MAELIAVIIIAGVLAAVALPRFSATTYGYDELRLYDQTVAALRYAQNTAVAHQRTVCATFTATQLTLTYAAAYGSVVCGTGLTPPGGGTAPYTVLAQGSASYAGAADFNYDRVGRPSIALPMTIAIGGRQIVVEAETGYVR